MAGMLSNRVSAAVEPTPTQSQTCQHAFNATVRTRGFTRSDHASHHAQFRQGVAHTVCESFCESSVHVRSVWSAAPLHHHHAPTSSVSGDESGRNNKQHGTRNRTQQYTVEQACIGRCFELNCRRDNDRRNVQEQERHRDG